MFQDHPLRKTLADELHARPYGLVDAPAQISHLALATGEGTATAEVKRSLLEFSLHSKEQITTALTIEISRHQYTQEYINLTKDFYLKM